MAGPAVLKFKNGLPQNAQFGERLRLLLVKGVDQGSCFCLLGDSISIGRENCLITILDENLSKKHAELKWQTDHYTIRDLGSINGIVHNGKKVGEAPIAAGDLLLLGTVALQVYKAGDNKKIELVRKNPSLKNEGKNIGENKQAKINESRKLLVIGVVVIALYIAYSSSEDHQTNRQHMKIVLAEEEAAPKNTGKPKTAKQKADEAERMKTVFDEYVPKYSADTPQRKDAEKFVRSGMRELQNKNYRRAISSFETALSVDPSHDLAKVYLTMTKARLYAEVEQNYKAAKQSVIAMRYAEARLQYQNILRLMEVSKDDQSYKEDKYYKDAIEGLEQIEKLEHPESTAK